MTVETWRDLASLHLRYVESRSPHLCDLLVERYRPLARHVAGRYRVSDADADDLDQVAMMGLLKALDRFDPSRGVQFSTFAWATVNGEIKRYFRDTRWVARVPRRIQQVSLETVRAIDDLTARLMREPTIDEVAGETGLSRTDAVCGIAAERARRVGSLSSGGHGAIDDRIDLAATDAGLRRSRAAATSGPCWPNSRREIKRSFDSDLSTTSPNHRSPHESG